MAGIVSVHALTFIKGKGGWGQACQVMGFLNICETKKNTPL